MIGSQRRLLILGMILGSTCFGAFWHNNDTRIADQVLPDPNSMNQNLVLNLNYSPTQIKTPLVLPETFLSHLPLREWHTKTSSFFYRKRYFMGASAILGGYAYACHYFVQANKYLERTDLWASWRGETSLELLITIPQHELAKELILEIQRCYSNAQNPTDFITPLITFMRAIDLEIITIKKYLSVYQWLTRLQLQNLFPINQRLFNLLGETCSKLIYIKNLFLVWAAEYKISHNKKKRFMSAFKPQ